MPNIGLGSVDSKVIYMGILLVPAVPVPFIMITQRLNSMMCTMKIQCSQVMPVLSQSSQ